MKLLSYWVNVIVVAVLLNIGYSYTMERLDKTTFRFFNYQILIMNGEFHAYDRIKTFEFKAKPDQKGK